MLEVVVPCILKTHNSVLALSTGVPFWFNIPLTILSAAVALSASFLALGSSLVVEVLQRHRFRHFIPIRSPDNESSLDEESNVDLVSRRSFNHAGDSQTSSTNAELEALLVSTDYTLNDLVGDSWAKKYLVTRLLWTFWYSCTTEGVMKGFFLGFVFVTMHYSGSILKLRTVC